MSDETLGALVDWRPTGRKPKRQPLTGATVTVTPIEPRTHGEDLYHLSHDDDPEGRVWTYLPYGPFPDKPEFLAWLDERAASEDPLFMALVDHASDRAFGMSSFMRMVPDMGVIEIGHIWISTSFQRSRPATEAVCLMMGHVFDLGYRRLEWKCNALNERSRRAAIRLGFTYEGIFRQHFVFKGRNRDSAWFSLLDGEWPRVKAAHHRWLASDNFDEEGRQRERLHRLTAVALAR